jgi:CHAT domain
MASNIIERRFDVNLGFYSLVFMDFVDGADELLKRLRQGKFDRPIFFQRTERWSATPLYYQLMPDTLERASAQIEAEPEDERPSKLFDLLNIHEHTMLDVLPVTKYADRPAVVLDETGQPVGVWVDKSAGQAPLPPAGAGPPPPSAEPQAPAPPPPPGGGGGGGSPPTVNGGGVSRPAAKRVPFRRTPHLDVSPEPSRPGDKFGAFVYLDSSAPKPDETSSAVIIDAPDEMVEFPIEVLLEGSPNLVVEGDCRKILLVKRDEAQSAALRFEITVGTNADSPNATLTATFIYDNRTCGRVVRYLKLAGIRGRARRRQANVARVPRIAIDAFAKPPDILVVVTESPEGDGRHFNVSLWTKLIDYQQPRPEAWNFNDETDDIVAQLMAGFTAQNADAFARQTALKGAGVALWDKAPQCFQDLFWELIDANLPPRTICISSAEPYIPWELMRPRRTKPSFQQREALGVEFGVGRWVDPDHQLPMQQAFIADSWVVAPNYLGVNKLQTAAAEAQFVCGKFGGRLVDPAEQRRLDDCLRAQPVDLLHFVCHGTSNGSVQELLLEGTSVLIATQIRGMDGLEAACRSKAPVVFLNACEVGRTTPALVGAGGFAVEFIKAGARCVIAPLWSVKDDIANQVAMEFYQKALAEPTRPFAEILTEIRQRAFSGSGGEDTFAAYCLYGDPLTALGA